MNTSQVKIEIYNFLEFFIGKKNLRRSYLKECIRKYNKANCIFIHIPKAGGTSVAEATIGHRAGHFTAGEVLEEMGSLKYRELFSFSITRHPLQRIYSSYNFIKNGGGEKGGVKRNKIFRSEYFRDFDAFVQDWLVQDDNIHSNILFKPQYEFIYKGNQILVNYIGRLEEVQEVNQVLTSKLNRPINIGVSNRTNPSIGHGWSMQSLKIIEHLYKEDFEKFGY